eukprot:TRINITY_DN24803_c0_g1_i1.p1 TRINITY_DN24803_c0_g1~~TRINITY_DN24803_c0_g1_i1.p1  ORF type:complete len:469 (+),score=83.99 TRINITY_DN24803_c0_g1_i1:55-1461(+)
MDVIMRDNCEDGWGYCPADLLRHIFKHLLSASEVLLCAAPVCKHWKALAYESDLFQWFYEKDFQFDPPIPSYLLAENEVDSWKDTYRLRVENDNKWRMGNFQCTRQVRPPKKLANLDILSLEHLDRPIIGDFGSPKTPRLILLGEFEVGSVIVLQFGTIPGLHFENSIPLKYCAEEPPTQLCDICSWRILKEENLFVSKWRSQVDDVLRYCVHSLIGLVLLRYVERRISPQDRNSFDCACGTMFGMCSDMTSAFFSFNYHTDKMTLNEVSVKEDVRGCQVDSLHVAKKDLIVMVLITDQILLSRLHRESNFLEALQLIDNPEGIRDYPYERFRKSTGLNNRPLEAFVATTYVQTMCWLDLNDLKLIPPLFHEPASQFYVRCLSIDSKKQISSGFDGNGRMILQYCNLDRVAYQIPLVFTEQPLGSLEDPDFAFGFDRFYVIAKFREGFRIAVFEFKDSFLSVEQKTWM